MDCVGRFCRRTYKNKNYRPVRNNYTSTLKKKVEYNNIKNNYNKNKYENSYVRDAYNKLISAIETVDIPQAKMNYIIQLLEVIIPQFVRTLKKDVFLYAKLREYIQKWKSEFSSTISLQSLFTKTELFLDSLHVDLSRELLENSKKNNITNVRLLINAGANPNVVDNKNNTPLIYALENDNIDMIQLLVQNGANTNIKSNYEYSYTPLIYAIKKENINLIQLLLQNGADINGKDNQYDTPLIHAIRLNNNDIVQLLLQNGADINMNDIQRYTPFVIAIHYGNIDIIESLIQYGIDVNLKTFQNNTPLIYAIQKDNGDIVQLLLRKGADPNIKDRNGMPPIIYAIYHNKINSVKILLQNGIDPNSLYNNKPILNYAIIYDRYEIVKILLDEGADVNYIYEINRSGFSSNMKIYNTPFINAIDYFDIFKLMLEYNDNINMQLPDGYTPLHYAVSFNKPDIVKLLLEKGADKEITTNDGLRAIDMATSISVKYLLEGSDLLNTSKTIKIPERNDNNEEQVNSIQEPIEDGNIIALLKPNFPDQRIVVRKSNGNITEGWKWLSTKKINPVTREPIQLNSLNYRKVIRPDDNENMLSIRGDKSGGRRKTRKQKRNLKQKQ